MKKKRPIDKIRRRLAGEVLIQMHRLLRDVVIFSCSDRLLKWYSPGLTPKERTLIELMRDDLVRTDKRCVALYQRMLPKIGNGGL